MESYYEKLFMLGKDIVEINKNIVVVRGVFFTKQLRDSIINELFQLKTNDKQLLTIYYISELINKSENIKNFLLSDQEYNHTSFISFLSPEIEKNIKNLETLKNLLFKDNKVLFDLQTSIIIGIFKNITDVLKEITNISNIIIDKRDFFNIFDELNFIYN